MESRHGRNAGLLIALKTLVVALLITKCVNCKAIDEPLPSDEQRLYRRLMRHLDKAVRPVRNSSTPVVVKLGITLTQIFDLDERNQVLTTNVWLDQEWTDEKLVWDPAEYGGLKKLRLPCDLIWLPDIVLYNSFDDYSGSYMRSLAMVSHDGTVFWPPIVRFRSSCKVDITYFPFDDQLCHLKLGSWAYDGLQLDVTNRSFGVDLSNYINNGEWLLLEATAFRNVMFYPCCPEPFPDMTFWLHLRRRTAHYTLNVILPCVMLSMLTLTTFFLPADSGEKVTLGLTVLLSFSVFNLLIAENIPAKSDSVPLLGIYLMVIMGLTSMSVIFSVLVLNVHHRGDLETRAPYWLRRLSLHFFSRAMCTVSQRDWRDQPPHAHLSPVSKVDSFNDGFVSRSPVQVYKLANGELLLHRNGSRRTIADDHESGEREGSCEAELLKYFRRIALRQEKEDQNAFVAREWRDIGHVLDRLLFWLFAGVTLVATLFLLIILPRNKPIQEV